MHSGNGPDLMKNKKLAFYRLEMAYTDTVRTILD